MIQKIEGGVTAPIGFLASGIYAGIKKNKEKNEVALIYSETPCAAAAVYTKNIVKADPVYVTMEHLKNGTAQCFAVNSGNANACAPEGFENAKRMCAAAADALHIKTEDVIVASTGVIGQKLPIEKIEGVMSALAGALSRDGSDAAARAIMTTDTIKKEIAVKTEIAGKTVVIGGICKGSGMIHPNMGTMLSFLTTDCAIDSALLQKALSESADKTYNRVSIDGDTSTNDMCAILANGLAGNVKITEENGDYAEFCSVLNEVNTYLAREVARDGEGCTRLITCSIANAKSEADAFTLSKSVISSSLVKAAMFGADANWGRVLCAMGYSGADFEPKRVDISFSSDMGRIAVCKDGAGLFFDEEVAKRVLLASEVTIEVDMKDGSSAVSTWGCDLTYDYVKINGDYRT